MSITNVNSFESRVNNSNFLTNYTDPYLKQSLANLGQRLSVKGDSIVSGEFKISDLFPNYLGDFHKEDMSVEFTWNKQTNSIIGKLVTLVKDNYGNYTGERKIIGEENTNSNANSVFTIGSINKVLMDISKDNYPSEIYLEDSNSINGSAYWHRNSAIIYRTYDNSIGKDVLIYKVVGHSQTGYDNEYICEEITTDGEFVEGFRIFITNESNLFDGPFINDNYSDKHEKFAMMYLHKNSKYDNKDSANQSQWTLDLYKFENNDNKFELGEITSDVDDDLWINISNNFDKDGIVSPSNIVKNLSELFTEENLALSNNGKPLFTKMYSLNIDEDTEENIGWKVKNWNPILGSPYNFGSICDNVGTDWDNDDEDDKTMIETRLEYFVNDTKQLFKSILSMYDDIVYKDNENMKLKKQIIGSLIMKLKEDADTQVGAKPSEYVDEYNVMFPVDYVIKYNLNSNDSSIIYNSLSSISINYCQLGTDDEPGKNIIENLYKISNHINNDGEIEENQQFILANGYENKSVLYDFTISYIDDDIISSIDWVPTFILPYIDNTGFWTINGVKTDQYARGSSSNGSGIIILNSNSLTEFNPKTDILVGPSELKNTDKDDWELKEFEAEYNSSNNIGGGDNYKLKAWVPSDKWLKSISNSDMFSYVNNTLFLCSSGMDMESNATYVSIINDIPNTYTPEEYYNSYYSNYDNYYLSEDKKYIYTYNIYNDSLTYILGTDNIVTSLWTCEKKTVNNIDTFSMTYVKRRGTDSAIDFAYLASLKNYIKKYASDNYVPSNHLFNWLVFKKANADLKNNTKSNNSFIYPVLKNSNATKYSATLASNSKAFGKTSEVELDENGLPKNNTERQYKNNLNFSLEFTDNVQIDNGTIKDVENSRDHRHFHITECEDTYIGAVSYISLDENGNEAIKVDRQEKTKKYGTIPNSIPYVKYPHEYIPNAEYDANEGSYTSYQYPMVDYGETLGRNFNILNRINTIGVGNKTIGETNKTVLWNAYFGVSWEDEDKSHLKIGSSSYNPNLGTSTMVDNESQYKLTKMDVLDVDMAYTNFAGDVIVNGHLKTKNQQWQINYDSDNKTYSYSAIFTPSGINRIIDIEKNSEISYDSDKINNIANIFHTVRYKQNGSNTYKYYNSQYYNYNEYCKDKTDSNLTYYKVSYLNISKLLADNNVMTDFNTYVCGDATRISKRYKETEDLLPILNVLKIQKSHPGVINQAYDFYVVNSHLSSDIPSENNDWYNYLKENYNDMITSIYNVLNSNRMKTTKGYIYNFKKNEDNEGQDLIQCIKKKSENENTYTYCKVDEIELGYSKVIVDNAVPYVDTIGLQTYQSAFYLELSTDLTDKENIISSGENKLADTVVSNPILITYYDKLDSYTGTFNVPAAKKIYTYMYVDKTKVENDNYTVNDIKDINPEKYAYNEIWTCDGCSKCSSASCPLITECNMSKVKGSYRISYGHFVLTDNESLDSYMKDKVIKNHVFQYKHERYNIDKFGNSYKYWTYAYYPTYTSKYIGNSIDHLKEVTISNENNVRMVLDANYNVVTYKEGETILSSYVYFGSCILCPSQQEFINENSKTLDSEYEYSYEFGSPTVGLKKKDESISLPLQYKLNDEYWNVKNLIEHDGSYYNGTYTYVTNTYENSQYTYFDEIEIPHEYSLTYRYVNVREMLSNNTIPQFYNETF